VNKNAFILHNATQLLSVMDSTKLQMHRQYNANKRKNVICMQKATSIRTFTNKKDTQNCTLHKHFLTAKDGCLKTLKVEQKMVIRHRRWQYTLVRNFAVTEQFSTFF